MSNEETKYKALDKVIQKVISGEADHKPRYWESWEELKRVELAMGYRHKFTTEQMEDVAEQAINEVWKDKNAYASAVVKERNIEALTGVETQKETPPTTPVEKAKKLSPEMFKDS